MDIIQEEKLSLGWIWVDDGDEMNIVSVVARKVPSLKS